MSEQEDRDRLRYLQLKAKAGQKNITGQSDEDESQKEETKGTFTQRLGAGTPEQRTHFGLTQQAEKEVFPRAAKYKKEAMEDGKLTMGERLRGGAAGAADLLSLGGRAIASAPTLLPGGEKFSDAIQRAEAPEKSGFIRTTAESIVRDPALIPATVSGLGLGKTIGSVGGAAAKVAAGAGAGAIEGAVSAGVHQLDKFGKTGKVDLGEAAIETGTGALVGGAIPAAGAIVKKSAKKLNKLVGELAEWTTGIDEKALRMGGNIPERELLKKAYDKQYEIGRELVATIENAHTQMDGYEDVIKALDKSPSINIQPFTSKLHKLKGKPLTKEMKGVASKLEGKIDEFRQLATKGDAGNVRPLDLLEFRNEIDKIIGSGFYKDSDPYITALKSIRHDIKDSFVKTAKGTEYEGVMSKYAKQLDAIDDMKRLVGWNEKSRELRAESFIKNINNKGRKGSKKWLDNFSEIFGGDFVKKAELARLAEMMGESGKGGVLPKWTTGRSLWAKGAGLAVGSPRVASQVTLPLTGKLGKEGATKTTRNLGKRTLLRGFKKDEEENKTIRGRTRGIGQQ